MLSPHVEQVAIELFNRIAAIADLEGHHPDLRVYNYNLVDIELSTHAVAGLTEDDFIMAVKIDSLPVQLSSRLPVSK